MKLESLLYYINLTKNPDYLKWFFLSKIKNNVELINKYSANCKSFGINRPYFILSFDCDTDKDASVVELVNEKLLKNNIHAMYAVPIEILKKSMNNYKNILDSGNYFINHGYRSHTNFNASNQSYEITLNYLNLNKQEIYEDILKAHNFLSDFLGYQPDTFRTPHFGYAQSKKQLNDIHNILMELNYKFSSSTNPFYGFSNKQVPLKKNNLLEFPISGRYTKPLSILDSWVYMINKNSLKPNDYIIEIKEYIKFFKEYNPPFILNIYADPSHIDKFDEFFRIIKELEEFNVRSYSEII